MLKVFKERDVGDEKIKELKSAIKRWEKRRDEAE